MKKFLSTALPAIVVALLLIPALSFTPLKNTATAQAWSKLGERKVNFKADRDVISGRWDGWFRALQIKVRGGSVNMQKMEVYYRNGQTEPIELKNNFTDGSESRVIDLPGARRLIEKVVFWYESTGTTTGSKPVVELWGRH
jgi:hypothetical protein